MRKRSARPQLAAATRATAVAAATTAALFALSACTSNSNNTAGGSTSPAAKGSSIASSSAPATHSVAPPRPAVITTSFTTQAISPSKPVVVDIANGRLTSVTMTNPYGAKVTGALGAGATSWHNTEDLGYSRTYRIVATGVNSAGVPVKKSTQVTTLSPSNQTMPYLQRIGGYTLDNGATYGVAIVPIVHFDEPITDEAAAQRALSVTTTPQVAGSWYWADNQNVHWRPQNYWPSGTKVTVSANVYGVDLGGGLYGQTDVSSSFTIGRKQLTVADDNAPNGVDTVRVYNAAGQVLRTMNTSMGEHSGETVNGQYINFYTPGGDYTVLEHDNPAIMSSASYGLPANAPGGYAPEPIYYSTKISIDGIYLHELDTTVWAQNSGVDVSHGCLNLDQDNAIWFYNNSMIGDPVVVHGTAGAPTIQPWEGGDWSIPWSQWVKGSAA